MDDFGRPVAYLALHTGTPVHDCTGTQVGTVERVLADEAADIFHGLVIGTPDGYRFADREQVGEIREQRVALTVPGTGLHQIADDPVARNVMDDADGDPVRDGLRRADRWLRE